MSKYNDNIDQLPVDNQPIPKNELAIINSIFKTKEGKDTISATASEFKDAILGVVLALIIFAFCLGDSFIKSWGCSGGSILLGIKVIVYVILFYIIKKRLIR